MTSRYQKIIPMAIVVFVIAVGTMLVYFQGRTGFETTQFDRCHGYGKFVAAAGETELNGRSAADLAETYGVAFAPGDVVQTTVCQPNAYSDFVSVYAGIGLLVGLPPRVDEAAIVRRQTAEPGWAPPAPLDLDAIYQRRFVPAEVHAGTQGCDDGWETTSLAAVGSEACHPRDWSVVADAGDYALLRSASADVGIFGDNIVVFASGCAEPGAIDTPAGEARICQSRATEEYRTIYGLMLPGGRNVSVRIAADATDDEEAVALRIAANVTDPAY